MRMDFILIFIFFFVMGNLAHAVCPHRDADDFVDGTFEIVEKGKPFRRCFLDEKGSMIETIEIPERGCRLRLKISRLSSKGKDINIKPDSHFSVTEFGDICSQKVGDKVQFKLRPNIPSGLLDLADYTCNVKTKEFVKKQTDKFIKCTTSAWEVMKVNE